jgi:hypothetical protein
MKQSFTKLLGAALLLTLTVDGFTAKAQTTLTGVTLAAVANKDKATKTDEPTTTPSTVAPAATKAEKADDVDTAWHPQRRLWGYAFGDAYFDQHSPAVTSTLGKENNYYQTPSNRSAFQFRRIYLGYDYEINKKFKAEVLLASEPNENTTPTTATSSVVNGDNLADGKMSFYIKNFNLRVREVWNGTDLVIGEMSTPGFALNEPGTNGATSLSETTWGYRSIERTITDFHKNNSYDVGAALQGTFDPKTKNYGYVFMVGDNTTSTITTVYNPNNAVSATNPNPNTGFFKIFYGDLWAKFLDQKLYIDLYADYAKTQSNTPVATTVISDGVLATQEHNMFKVFVSYNSSPLTVGVEAYTQKFGVGVTDKNTLTAEDVTAQGISLWAKGAIVKNKWGWFARYDAYNPDTKFNSGNTYTVNTNYGSYDPTVKEKFVTAGLDFTPAKNIHFMPNIWFTQYEQQLAPTTAGYLPNDHTLIYRATFFYTFGK